MAWSRDKIAALSTKEVQQLRTNAQARDNQEIIGLCDEVLAGRPKPGTPRRTKRQHELDGRPLVSRKRAFEMRGVTLRNPRWSWGGVRPTDGTVVLTIWENEVQASNGINRYLLWGPNRGGDQPWSDTLGGQERLEHCRLALKSGEAEGLFIYGETQGGDLPMGVASKVSGADPNRVLRFKVQLEGDEYWAVWGAEISNTE